MSQTRTCPTCGKELEGAVEATYIRLGERAIYFWNETPDCNWNRCRVCKKVFCKDCFQGEEQTCSNECFFVGIAGKLRTYIRKSRAETAEDEAVPNADTEDNGESAIVQT